MMRIVYEGPDGVEAYEDEWMGYDEVTQCWIIAPNGPDDELRRRIPRERVYHYDERPGPNVGIL